MDAVDRVVAVLVVAYVAQVVLIVVPFIRRRPGTPGDPGGFDWHLLIPCRDEAVVIEDTVRRLTAQFPAAHIWCIDDASTDGTGVLLDALARDLPNVHVVHRVLPDARLGKGPALNAGWRAIAGWVRGDRERTIVGVIDADGHLDAGCLAMVAGPECFGSAAVGAVQIQVRVADRNARRKPGPAHGPSTPRLLIRLQDSEFTGAIAAQQHLRRRLGSVGMGGNGQFTRLACLDGIAADHGTPWHGSLLEDFELGVHVLLSGRRSQYCHDTWVEQEGLADLRALVRQRSRWAQGNMQCWTYLSRVLRSPRISTFGALEITHFLLIPWLQLLGSLLFGLATLSAAVGLARSPDEIHIGTWALVPIVAVVLVGPFVVWGAVYRHGRRPDWSWARAAAFGAAHWPYSTLHHVATWYAFGRWLRDRSDWIKTERTAAPALGSAPSA